MHLRAALISAVAFSLSCTFVPRFHCAEHGGASWAEYRNQHFILVTDAPEAKAAALFQQLEELRAADLVALLGEQVEIPGRLRVLAFARMTDFEDFAGDVGGYYGRDDYGHPTIVVPANVMRDFPEALPHELAHYISFYLFPVQPMWFSEGLAGFVQTLPLGRRNVAGSLPKNFGQFLGYDAKLSARDILRWKGVENSWVAGRYHVWSWLLYHWLWNHRGAAFAQFQKRLMDGDDPDEAWAAAFPEYDARRDDAMASLDAELYSYRTNLKFVAYRVNAVTPAAQYSKTALPPSEAHVLLLALRRRWSQDRKVSESFARAQLDEALREDPSNAGAMIALARRDGGITAKKARTIVEASPRDWRAWRVLGTATDATAAEKEAANRKAIELNPDDWISQNNLAWTLAKNDRAREALPFANRALDLAPWSPSAVDTLAEIAAQLGRCQEALRLVRRAARMQELRSGRHEEGQKRQSEVEGRCPGSVATPASPL